MMKKTAILMDKLHRFGIHQCTEESRDKDFTDLAHTVREIYQLRLPPAHNTFRSVSGFLLIGENATGYAGKAMGTQPEHPLHLLVVDDDTLLVHFYEKFFTELGHTVTTVTSGSAALQAVDQPSTSYDGVLTALAMAEMDGLTLRDKLKAREADLPVIAVSTWASHPDYQEHILQEFDGALGKPFKLRELRALLSELMD